MTAEHSRVDEAREQKVLRKKWGPYPGGRQLGTVREDNREEGVTPGISSPPTTPGRH